MYSKVLYVALAAILMVSSNAYSQCRRGGGQQGSPRQTGGLNTAALALRQRARLLQPSQQQQLAQQQFQQRVLAQQFAVAQLRQQQAAAAQANRRSELAQRRSLAQQRREKELARREQVRLANFARQREENTQLVTLVR